MHLNLTFFFLDIFILKMDAEWCVKHALKICNFKSVKVFKFFNFHDFHNLMSEIDTHHKMKSIMNWLK